MNDEQIKDLAQVIQGWKRTEVREGDVLLLSIPRQYGKATFRRNLKQVADICNDEGIRVIFMTDEVVPMILKRENL